MNAKHLIRVQYADRWGQIYIRPLAAMVVLPDSWDLGDGRWSFRPCLQSAASLKHYTPPLKASLLFSKDKSECVFVSMQVHEVIPCNFHILSFVYVLFLFHGPGGLQTYSATPDDLKFVLFLLSQSLKCWLKVLLIIGVSHLTWLTWSCMVVYCVLP